MFGTFRKKSAIFAATLFVVLVAVVIRTVDASSWQDYSSASRPDPPGYSGRPPPPKRPDEYDLNEKSAESSYNPIHYQFPLEENEESRRRKRPVAGRDLSDGVPLTGELDRESFIVREDNHEDRPFASPRTDLITRFISTKKGRGLLTLSSGAVGAALGTFVGKSLLNHASPLNLVFAALFVVCTVLRNPYGELSRALGMALILALQRTSRIRRQYPTWPHVKACLAAGPRMPTDYPLLPSVASMAAVGVACGANLRVPLLPSWMGATAGGASFAFVATLPTAAGDLARSMGMRVVSLLEEVVAINAQLRILSKGATVSGKIFDKIMILDRKHRIKDKIVTVFSFAYDAVSKTASKVQSDMKDDDDDNRGGDRTTRGDARRGDDRGDERRGEPRRRDEGWRNDPRTSDERRERDNDVGGTRDEPPR